MRTMFQFTQMLTLDQILNTFPERNESSVSFCSLGVSASTEELPPVRKEILKYASRAIFFIVRSMTLAVIFRSTKIRHRTLSKSLLDTDVCHVSVTAHCWKWAGRVNKNITSPEREKYLDELMELRWNIAPFYCFHISTLWVQKCINSWNIRESMLMQHTQYRMLQCYTLAISTALN